MRGFYEESPGMESVLYERSFIYQLCIIACLMRLARLERISSVQSHPGREHLRM